MTKCFFINYYAIFTKVNIASLLYSSSRPLVALAKLSLRVFFSFLVVARVFLLYSDAICEQHMRITQ